MRTPQEGMEITSSKECPKHGRYSGELHVSCPICKSEKMVEEVRRGKVLRKPKLKSVWFDFIGRELVVTRVYKPSTPYPDGRIEGQITFDPTASQSTVANNRITRDYSCTLTIFEHIWYRQQEPPSAEQMKMNENTTI